MASISIALLIGGAHGTPAVMRLLVGVDWLHRAISPLLRSDFAQSTAGHLPNGDLTDSFVPATEEPSFHRAVGRRDRRTALGRSPTMQTTPRRNLVRIVPAKLLSVIRGDKYMANAYPPAWYSAADPVTPKER